MFLVFSGCSHLLTDMSSRCVQMISDVRICFQKITNVGCWIFSTSSLGVLLMFLGCSQAFPRIFPGFSQDVPMGLVSVVGLGGLVWSFGSSRSGGSCGFCGSCGSSGFGGSCESDWLGGSGRPGESCGYFLPI